MLRGPHKEVAKSNELFMSATLGTPWLVQIGEQSGSGPADRRLFEIPEMNTRRHECQMNFDEFSKFEHY